MFQEIPKKKFLRATNIRKIITRKSESEIELWISNYAR